MTNLECEPQCIIRPFLKDIMQLRMGHASRSVQTANVLHSLPIALIA
jgi:hypothetical protein